jgi:hypothetical protein
MGSVRSLFLLLLVGGLLLAPASRAQAPAPQSISAMCRTPAATGDGVGYRCVSEPTRLQAPDGYAFAPESLKGGVADSAGPEPRCDVQWSEEVALAPGSAARQPRLLTVRASASSQRGYGRRGPGWTDCSYTVDVVPYTPQ